MAGPAGFEPATSGFQRRNHRTTTPQASVLILARPRTHQFGLQVPEHTGKIVSTLIKLKNRGLAKGTLRNVSFQLKHLVKNVDIDKPAEVKAYVANKKCANSYKANLVKALQLLCLS
jgi:hypothetical protein